MAAPMHVAIKHGFTPEVDANSESVEKVGKKIMQRKLSTRK
jgi:hypothetical protein